MSKMLWPVYIHVALLFVRCALCCAVHVGRGSGGGCVSYFWLLALLLCCVLLMRDSCKVGGVSLLARSPVKAVQVPSRCFQSPNISRFKLKKGNEPAILFVVLVIYRSDPASRKVSGL